MKLSQIEEANTVRREFEEAKRQRKDLKDYVVVSVSIARGKNETAQSAGAIELSRGRSGTGSLSCIGLPEELAGRINMAIEEWINSRVKDAEARLETLGIDLAA